MRLLHELRQRRLAQLGITTGLVAILVGLVMERLWSYQATAERYAVTYTVAALRQAVGLQLAEVVTGKGLAALAQLDGANPMALLDKPLPNYLGELTASSPETIPSYHWYFDSDSRMLVYRVHNTEAFHNGLGPPARIRLKVRLTYRDGNENGRFDPPSDTFQGLDLVPVEPYHWITAEEKRER